jgi:hypothetical protein
MNSRIVSCFLLLALSGVAWADEHMTHAATGGEQAKLAAEPAEPAEPTTEAASRIQ